MFRYYRGTLSLDLYYSERFLISLGMTKLVEVTIHQDKGIILDTPIPEGFLFKDYCNFMVQDLYILQLTLEFNVNSTLSHLNGYYTKVSS